VRTLTGTVVSGTGDLARWMVQYHDLYTRVTGVELYPGSLNVMLAEDYHLPPNRLRLEPADYGGRVGMNLVPCLIDGLHAFILRTDQNEGGVGHHPHNVIEVAAPVRLRDALNLSDGDAVLVEIDD
jgi:riboflavin kinase, archaea type